MFLYDLYKLCFSTFKHDAVERVCVSCAEVFVGNELHMRRDLTKKNTRFQYVTSRIPLWLP
jgi:hypothetical protein